ncbi:MAG: PleD family two-component system response regulator [Candidatus Hadarchaeaceae archaeon]
MPKKIMVVDDDLFIRKAVKITLEGEGYDVVTASSGEECLKKLRKEKIDLMLTDVFMPRMSGIRLCEMIRKNKKLKPLKIAFLTVATFSKMTEIGLEGLNIIDYIQKPFDNEDLVRRVKRIVS